jgi:hypothetical protein
MNNALESYTMEYEDIPIRKLHLRKRGTHCTAEEKRRRKAVLARRKADRIKKKR